MTPADTVLVLDGAPDDLFLVQEIRAVGARSVSLYDPAAGNRFASLVRRARGSRRPPFSGDPSLLPDAGAYIIFDSDLALTEARWIRRLRPDARVVIWYWNPLRDQACLEARSSGIEIWTFDVADAERFGLLRNTQFYFESQAATEQPKLVDVSFVGRDKGRTGQVAALERQLVSLGFTTDFTVVGAASRWRRGRTGWIPYRDVIARSARSVAVLDVVQPGQSGLTLRAMEALFLDVKLLTDNRFLMTEGAYPVDNAYFIGDDDLTGLSEFMRRPVSPADPDIRRFYSFAEWLGRFDA